LARIFTLWCNVPQAELVAPPAGCYRSNSCPPCKVLQVELRILAECYSSSWWLSNVSSRDKIVLFDWKLSSVWHYMHKPLNLPVFSTASRSNLMSPSTGLWRVTAAAARGPIKHNLAQLTEARGWDSRPSGQPAEGHSSCFLSTFRGAHHPQTTFRKASIKIWAINHEKK
jgi:hypothetical protein